MQSEVKNILEIQRQYFSLLKDCYKEPYVKVLEANGDTEAGLNKWLRENKGEDILYNFTRRTEDISNFWKKYDKQLIKNIVSLDLLPIYSISRPMYLKKQLASTGLYCDFVVCHDESPATLKNCNALPKNRRVNFALNVIRDYIDMLLLEPCFTSDSDTVFAVLCPGERDINEDIFNQLMRKGKELTLKYANDLLDTKYLDFDDLKYNTQKIIGSASIKKAIKRPELLPAPFQEPKDNFERLNQCFERMRMLQQQSLSTIPEKPDMYLLILSFLTELTVMESQIHGSLETDSAPLLPRYTWDLYKWRISKGNDDSSKILGWQERKETAITSSLQHENLDWLCNIPLEAVIKLRHDGYLEEFRGKIRNARKRMTIREGLDFKKISEDIQKEIENAITEQQESINKLEQEAHARVGMETTKFIGKIWFAVTSCWVPIMSLVKFFGDAAEYAVKMKDEKKILESLPDRLKRGPWGILIETKQK